jgi:hypothetical protein
MFIEVEFVDDEPKAVCQLVNCNFDPGCATLPTP